MKRKGSKREKVQVFKVTDKVVIGIREHQRITKKLKILSPAFFEQFKRQCRHVDTGKEVGNMCQIVLMSFFPKNMVWSYTRKARSAAVAGPDFFHCRQAAIQSEFKNELFPPPPKRTFNIV